MTSSGLASPPRAAPSRVHKPAPTPPEPPRRPERSPPSYGRILVWSLGFSLFVHLLLLLISPTFIRVGPPPGAPAAPQAEPSQAFGVEMIVPIPSENAPDVPVSEAPPEDQPPPTPTPPRTVVPVLPGPGGGPAPPAATPPSGEPGATDVLRPGYRDPRLYVTPDEYPELRRTEHERYMEHLEARIDAVNDSMGIAAARNSRTSDWTVTDRDGNRWGLSPDGLHLGGVTIPRAVLPLPAATGDNQQLEEERERLRMREEIQDQAAGQDRERTSDERIEAIRERQDELRDGDGS
ncbi:MAG: hypothetical protein WD766_10855 [Gemmatimonadota bacterium]